MHVLEQGRPQGFSVRRQASRVGQRATRQLSHSEVSFLVKRGVRRSVPRTGSPPEIANAALFRHRGQRRSMGAAALACPKLFGRPALRRGVDRRAARRRLRQEPDVGTRSTVSVGMPRPTTTAAPRRKHLSYAKPTLTPPENMESCNSTWAGVASVGMSNTS